MSDLRDLLEALGFASARSLLQSGNLIFEGQGQKGAALERVLEEEAEKRLGVSVAFIVRTAEEWNRAVERNPFPKEAQCDPGHLLVVFLKAPASANNVSVLQAAIKGPEVVRADGKHLYVTYPVGIAGSKLTNALIEQKLGTRGTARNWNTVLKVAALTKPS